MKRKKVEQIIQECYSTWGKSYYKDYYGKNAPYPPVHRDLIISEIRKARPKSLLDAGCGPASFLRDIQSLKIKKYGFDLTKEMVDEARHVLTRLGQDPRSVWRGSILQKKSFFPPHESTRKHFDCIVCSGVLPHIREQDDKKVFRNIYDVLSKNGRAIIEARNELFSLFTMNRFTYEFVTEKLIDTENWKKKRPALRKNISSAERALARQFRMDLPPIRKGQGGKPGYDEVLSRTHNPLLVREQLFELGFRKVDILYYHFHCTPPFVSAHLQKHYRPECVLRESPKDWRGLFMASAFLAVAHK